MCFLAKGCHLMVPQLLIVLLALRCISCKIWCFSKAFSSWTQQIWEVWQLPLETHFFPGNLCLKTREWESRSKPSFFNIFIFKVNVINYEAWVIVLDFGGLENCVLSRLLIERWLVVKLCIFGGFHMQMRCVSAAFLSNWSHVLSGQRCRDDLHWFWYAGGQTRSDVLFWLQPLWSEVYDFREAFVAEQEGFIFVTQSWKWVFAFSIFFAP